MNAEQQRLDGANKASTPWPRWGPYLSERQWGTVRLAPATKRVGPASSRAMHLFVTKTPQQILQLGKAAAFVCDG
jgi:hypothetical protein